MKPVFRGYDQWAAAVGDPLTLFGMGQRISRPVLDEIKPAADAVLAEANK